MLVSISTYHVLSISKEIKLACLSMISTNAVPYGYRVLHDFKIAFQITKGVTGISYTDIVSI